VGLPRARILALSLSLSLSRPSSLAPLCKSLAACFADRRAGGSRRAWGCFWIPRVTNTAGRGQYGLATRGPRLRVGDGHGSFTFKV